jgi:outer membrane protein assembly factor BamB
MTDRTLPVTAGTLAFLFLVTVLGAQVDHVAQRDWSAYGGDAEGTRYSPLTQINRSNIGQLRVAWQFDPGAGGGRFQAQPIVINGILYTVTPDSSVVALDGATGKLKWSWNSGARTSVRGITYWTDGKQQRLFAAFGRYIYAVDAVSGKPFPDFGRGGRIDLYYDLDRDPEQQSVSLTTPGVIYKDLYIVGGRTPESLPASYGDIRAYDVRTGKLRWTFHTVPRPGEFGYETWPKNAWTYTGAANNWAGMAVDVKRGIVFVPTGSAAADFYGANRIGDDLFANTLLALDATTGKRVWHFQGVKHDIWDRDFPSPPTLVTVKRDGNAIDAVAQTTKHGFVFLFDRANGAPLFPIEYRRVLPSKVEGEVAAGMQPFSTVDRRHVDHSNAAGAPVGARAVQDVPQRGAVRPVHGRQGDRALPRVRRRCRVGRVRPRSNYWRVVRERQRHRMDVEHAPNDAGSEPGAPDVSRSVRGVPRREHVRRLRLPIARRHRDTTHTHANRRDYPERIGSDAGLLFTSTGDAGSAHRVRHERQGEGSDARRAVTHRHEIRFHWLP